MTTRKYLKQKYSFENSADMPIGMLAEELQITQTDAKKLARFIIGRNTCCLTIDFETYIECCAMVLDEGLKI